MNGYKEKKLRHDVNDIRTLLSEGVDGYYIRDVSSNVESKTAVYRLVGTVDMPSSAFVTIAKKQQGAFLVRGGDLEWELALPCELTCERLDKMVQIYSTAAKKVWNRLRKTTKRFQMAGLYKEDSSSDADTASSSLSSDCDIKAVKGDKGYKRSSS